jgi:hypothetical protein
MDISALRDEVRQAVFAKIDAREPFTNVDISHPIIHKHGVRHREVRAIIDEIWNSGELQNEEYTTSTITVYPQPNKPVAARLFHPDESDFDPNSYTAVNQELIRDQNKTQASTRGFKMIDSSGDDGSQDGPTAITSTVSGHKVTAQCQIQPKEGSLNIPRRIIKQAGFTAGDQLDIKQDNGSVKIQKGGNDQKVDSEGRIRLHGSTVADLGKPGEAVTVLLVTSNDGKLYIQVQ